MFVIVFGYLDYTRKLDFFFFFFFVKSKKFIFLHYFDNVESK